MRCSRRALLLGATVLGALAIAAPAPRAWAGATDYRPENTGWNGLSAFCALARGMGLRPLAVTSLAWDDLGPGDVLLLVYPRAHIAPRDLLAFVKGGGRVVLADDFGDAGPALAAFGLERHPARADDAPLYHGHAHLPIAVAVDATSPLAEGVGGLVTNHPAAFDLPITSAPGRADVVFELDPAQAVVVDERVGEGRLVALSDPSVLINEMQAVPEDAAFATSLLRSLTTDLPAGAAATTAAHGDAGAGRAPRLLLAIQGFATEGALDDRASGPAAGGTGGSSARTMALAFNQWLDGLGDYVARAQWLLGLAILLALGVALALRRVLPWSGGRAQDPTWGVAGDIVRASPLEVLLAGPSGRRSRAALEGPVRLLREELEARLLAAGASANRLHDPATAAAEARDAATRAAGSDAGRIAEDLTRELLASPSSLPARRLDRALGLGGALFQLLDMERSHA